MLRTYSNSTDIRVISTVMRCSITAFYARLWCQKSVERNETNRCYVNKQISVLTVEFLTNLMSVPSEYVLNITVSSHIKD